MASDALSYMDFSRIDSGMTRKMSVEERCIAAIPVGTQSRVEMYNVSIDGSKSVGDNNLKSFFTKGLPNMVDRMWINSKARNRIAFVRITIFATDVEVLLDWTNVAKAREQVERLATPKAGGVTRLDLAIRDSMGAIDRMKAAIDSGAAKVKRGGAVNFVVTDGRLTDENGNEIPVPDDLADMISNRQKTHATSSILLGIGESVYEEQLVKLAPPTVTKSGVRVAQAAMYKHSIFFEDPEDEEHFWVMVSQLIADTSSKNSTPGFSEAFLSLEEIEIVGA